MSFDLIVEAEAWPENLTKLWEREFINFGISCELCPNFSVASWKGGFLPFRLISAPESLIGVSMPSEGVSGFEVSFNSTHAFFRSASGRPSPEFAMVNLGAAFLTKLTSGSFTNPQSGETVSASNAVRSATVAVESYMKAVPERERKHYKFPSWEALGVKV